MLGVLLPLGKCPQNQHLANLDNIYGKVDPCLWMTKYRWLRTVVTETKDTFPHFSYHSLRYFKTLVTPTNAQFYNLYIPSPTWLLDVSA